MHYAVIVYLCQQDVVLRLTLIFLYPSQLIRPLWPNLHILHKGPPAILGRTGLQIWQLRSDEVVSRIGDGSVIQYLHLIDGKVDIPRKAHSQLVISWISQTPPTPPNPYYAQEL